MRLHFVFAATAMLLAAGACPAQANSAGGAILPNADIRALEPPIDVTEEQLRAQGTPVPAPPLVDDRSTSRSKGLRHTKER